LPFSATKSSRAIRCTARSKAFHADLEDADKRKAAMRHLKRERRKFRDSLLEGSPLKADNPEFDKKTATTYTEPQ
jgi:hypothetical protein